MGSFSNRLDILVFHFGLTCGFRFQNEDFDLSFTNFSFDMNFPIINLDGVKRSIFERLMGC